MRIIYIFILSNLLACTSNSTQKQVKKDQKQHLLGKYKNRIYSPDKTKYIEIFRNGSLKGEAITQVFIHFDHGATQVYSAKGIDNNIKASWINNDHINITPSSQLNPIHKKEITHLFSGDISISYH